MQNFVRNKSSQQKDSFLVNIIQAAKLTKKYLVPAIGRPPNTTDFLLCANAFMSIHNIGKTKSKTLRQHAASNIIHTSVPKKMANKTNSQKPSAITDFLITFFEEKMSQSYPRATLTVRTEAGKTELRDTDDIVELPTY